MRALVPAVLAATVFVATPALADKLPLPKAAYSADVVFESKGRDTPGRVFVDGPKERRESKNAAGQPVVVIIRRDKGKVFDLKPQRKLAISLRIAAAQAAGDTGAPGTDIDSFYGAEAMPQGTETVAGLQTTKYAIELKEAGGGFTVSATVWCTEDGIIAKIVGKTSLDFDSPPAKMELKNVKQGPQDAALFEVPPGMSVLSTDSDSDTPVAAPEPAPAAPNAPPVEKKP
ncbi:MAG TPA: hypothetical protein VL899_09940 [Alphaproteobacteria bacterium]|jgi:hypothetical protein|nr:hypothetical protein [Alphaproteobacteria bacterium]